MGFDRQGRPCKGLTMQLKEENIIFETIAGSNSYGLATPESDVDFRGVILSEKEYLFGMEKFEQFHGFKNEDRVLFELRFAFRLMADCNPNIIELLYTSKKHWLLSTPFWEEIIANRKLFLSKKVKHTFSGFAFQQIRKIRNHKRWLENPIKDRPTRKEFGLPEKSIVPKEQLTSILTLDSKFVSGDFKDYAIKEKAYQQAVKQYNSYVHWKNERNEKRKKLEEKCGYDAKHAMHLIRLCRMRNEILETHRVHVDRSNIDKDYLMSIRNCEVPWEYIEKEVNESDIKAEELYNTTTLQHSADRKKINDLAISIYESVYC